MYTVCSNIKYLLLKLLCILAFLCEGTPLQPLRPDFFGIGVLVQIYDFSLFVGRTNRTRRQARRAHERAPLPNRTTPSKWRSPPTYHVSPTKLIARRTISRRPHAPQEELFPSHRAEIFALVHSPFFFPSHIVATLPVPVIPHPSIR